MLSLPRLREGVAVGDRAMYYTTNNLYHLSSRLTAIYRVKKVIYFLKTEKTIFTVREFVRIDVLLKNTYY